MTTKFSAHRYFWMIFAAILAACGNIPPATVPVITRAPTPLPTFTPVAFPTAGLLRTKTATPTPTPFPIVASSEKFPLENLRMAYIVDGNLYVQDGSNSPKKLSDSGEDWNPMFSDDGGKIVFYRGKTLEYHNSIFSVNADGSQMQEIITTAWLDALGAGTKAGHLAVVPNTHQIIFNTYLCPEYDPSSDSGCTVGLFLVDTDTGELKEIIAPTLGGWLPVGGDSRWIRNFSISPDRKLLSIAHAGQIDIVDINGKAIHRSILTYSPGMPFELYPIVYWFSDSSGLIAALPAETEYAGPLWGGDPTYTIWRYIFDGKVATQIPLDPPPSWIHMESNDMISISPNRKWAIYFTEDYKVYKGNLLDGSTELLLPGLYYLPMQWSSDNIHFANGSNPAEPILGSVDMQPSYGPGHFLGWIDAQRFIYFPPSTYEAYANKEDIQILVGDFDGKVLYSHESNVFVPYPYSSVFITVGSK